MTTAIVWLRRDLRLHDNPALRAAVEHHDTVVPVYIHAPDEETPWAPGAAARWWLHHSLTALTDQLAKHTIPLILRHGAPSSLAALQALVKETGAAAVYWNRLYDPATIQRDSKIKSALQDGGITAESFNAALLWEPWTVTTGSGSPYRVFTPFWKSCRGSGDELAAPQPKPDFKSHKAPTTLTSVPLADLDLLPEIRWDQGLADVWQPGETGAHTRLEKFCDQILPDYETTRNLPATDGVSQLSPHLHWGELSPRQVWRAVAERCQGSPLEHTSAEAYLREIGWREFAYHVLYHFPHSTEQPVQEKFAAYPWRNPKDDDYQRLLRAWQRGQTGIPLVDAGMRQLWHSGWMHNRVRMIVASFLTKNLRIHWLEGARWFWDTLVDADLASNSMGWQWTAGSGFDAAPYFRVFNPVRQGEQYDPNGDYTRHWVTPLAKLPKKWLHKPWQINDNTLPPKYPKPIVDLDRSRKDALAGYEKVKSA